MIIIIRKIKIPNTLFDGTRTCFHVKLTAILIETTTRPFVRFHTATLHNTCHVSCHTVCTVLHRAQLMSNLSHTAKKRASCNTTLMRRRKKKSYSVYDLTSLWKVDRFWHAVLLRKPLLEQSFVLSVLWINSYIYCQL